MVSAVQTEKLFSDLKIEMFDHDPGGTAAAIVTPDGGSTEQIVDLADYNGFAVIAMSSLLSGAGITLVEIIASASSDGSNPVIVKSSGAVVADAVGDTVVLECTAEEITELDNSLQFVAGRLTVANAADEAVVTYIRGTAKRKTSGLTANVIA